MHRPTPRARRRAFTLIELLVVILIMGVVMSILLPSFSAIRNASKRTASRAQLGSLVRACEHYFLSFQEYPGIMPNQYWHATAGETRALDFSSNENLVLSLMGGVVFDTSGETFRDRWVGPPSFTSSTLGVGANRVIALERIGQGPLVRAGPAAGSRERQLDAFYIPKPGELEAVRGATNDNRMPEFIDVASGMPILYLRSSGSHQTVVHSNSATGSMFQLSQIRSYAEALALESSQGGPINQNELSLLSVQAAGTVAARNESLAWAVINPQLSRLRPGDTHSVTGAGSSGAQRIVPRGEMIFLAPGPNGIYLEAAAMEKRDKDRITEVGDLDFFDDVVEAGGSGT